MKTVAIVGTFDSKGEEFLYLKNVIESNGFNTLMIHCGVFEPAFEPEINNDQIVQLVDAEVEELVNKRDRAYATEILTYGMQKLIPKLYEEGKFDGIISLGGSGGTAIATSGMRMLPIGVPKVMVSTMAAGNVSQYVGTSDIFMYPSVVDVAGVNSISVKVFTNAANAISGMLNYEAPSKIEEKPLIAATMFGVTTPCIENAREYLENQGYEVLVFHANGTGGKSMETLVESGFIKGVLDITTTEWCDELFGGVLNAGPKRLEAAGRKGIPQVVSTGALDMINFGPIDTLPENFRTRNIYKHNPMVTLVRTTIEENRQLGEKLCEKLNSTKSPTALMLPLGGNSLIDTVDQPFYGPKEDEALFETIRENINLKAVELIELNCPINDTEFAVAAAKKLVELINNDI